MQLEYDSTFETLVKSLRPRWTEIRVKKASSWRPEAILPFIVSEVLLIGEQSLFCCVDSKTALLTSGEMDYFPIFLEIRYPNDFSMEDYPRLARAGGTTDLDKRLQWLFDHPSLRLIEDDEGMADGMGPDANWDYVHYYGGLELTDPASKKKLQIIGTHEVDFTLELKITD